jgi:CRISPR-associated protein Csx17
VHLPFAVELRGSAVAIPVDPAPLRLLASGEAGRAFEVIARRLRGAGLVVPYRAASVDARTARRLAASLAFPLSPATAASFARSLEHPIEQEPSHAR